MSRLDQIATDAARTLTREAHALTSPQRHHCNKPTCRDCRDVALLLALYVDHYQNTVGGAAAAIKDHT